MTATEFWIWALAFSYGLVIGSIVGEWVERRKHK